MQNSKNLPKQGSQKKCPFHSAQQKSVPFTQILYQNNLWTLFSVPKGGPGFKRNGGVSIGDGLVPTNQTLLFLAATVFFVAAQLFVCS